MKRPLRLVLAAVLVLLALAGGGVWILQSRWFFNRVRAKLVETIEIATGGKVEIASFDFQWRRLRAEVKDLVLHGTEPEGKPPLLRAAAVRVDLKIVSMLQQKVDVEAVEVTLPQVYLMVHADGTTNVPAPSAHQSRKAMDTILDIAIGRFDVRDGIAEVEARGKTPFGASGRNLQAKLQFDRAGARYHGPVSVKPLVVSGTSLEISLNLSLERNRILASDGKARTGNSEIGFQGGFDDLAKSHAVLRYDLRADGADVARLLKVQGLAGTLTSTGVLNYADGFSVEGDLHAWRLRYAELRDLKADGRFEVKGGEIHGRGLRLNGVYADGTSRLPLSAQIQSVTYREENLDVRGLALAAAGGSFNGAGSVRAFDRFRAEGRFAGFEIARLASTYLGVKLPWDGRLSGTARVEGRLKNRAALHATAGLTISPAATGAPVSGLVQVDYDRANGMLDLGRSFIALPNSRLDFSGAVGRQLHVQAESRDLGDILPALGAGNVPVKLEGGTVVFEGDIAGKLDDPRIAGHITSGRISYGGVVLDSLATDASIGSASAQVRNVVAAHGAMRIEGEAAVGLVKWSPVPASSVTGAGAIRNANLAEQTYVAATGIADIEARVSGTVEAPEVTATVTATAGTVLEEPFDRVTGKVTYSNRMLRLESGQVTAAAKQISVQASYEHAAGKLEGGSLRFEVTSNPMRLGQIQTLRKGRPGIRGTVEVKARGALELSPFRITDLHADIAGRNLQLTGQALGDAHLTAESTGDTLHATVTSGFANSGIHGEGEWKLTGDYPGSASITFSKLDFAELREWAAPHISAQWLQLTGSAEGELRLEGPARKPELLKATLRIPKLEAAPAPSAVGNPGPLALHNQGPIVVSMTNQVITVESARLVGRNTDLAVTGRVLLQQRNPFDLRVNGRIDLALMQELDHDLLANGTVTTDATVRGSLQSPLLTGRMEMKDAALNVLDFPNGISRANGVILFTGDRATIESLTGETGGGKVTLSGFAGYGVGEMVFRLHASAEEVRVRYPEGVSTVADAELNFSGTTSRSMLAGTITVVRTGFNPQSDFSSILAKSGEPVRTPASRTGFLGGLNFDVQIATAPDITFQSSLAEGLQVEANLRLRGTASNPALLGRVNVTQGQITFFGTKYSISQGSIGFYNPVKVEPVVNVDLETKARGVDVTLSVTGTLGKLSLSPRSDPPLQFSEIVALLATGRAPTGDPTSLAQQASSTQSWQQTGASALLGQAIANPVAGRLQRFFGVSKLKIDPTLTGVENNPQARLTLEQQVTQNITFTYITNLTSSNPQVVRVEWAFARKWSAVAVRDENGLIGLDFFYKRRFK